MFICWKFLDLGMFWNIYFLQAVVSFLEVFGYFGKFLLFVWSVLVFLGVLLLAFFGNSFLFVFVECFCWCFFGFVWQVCECSGCF